MRKSGVRNDIRWGIIGCGDVVEKKSGPALQRVDGSRVVAVMRRTEQLAENFAKRHNISLWTSRAEDLITNPDIDAVYIATPPGYHLEYALKVCNAGKPCIIEKPLGRSSVECARVIEEFKRAGIPLFVPYYRRYLPKFIKVKEILDSGIPGKITSITYRYSSPERNDNWRVDPSSSGGGLFWDIGCHTLDLFDFWFDPIELIGSTTKNCINTHDVEDVIAVTFSTPDGIPGSGIWNFVSHQTSDSLEINGLHGKITLACQDCWSPLNLTLYPAKPQSSYHPDRNWKNISTEFISRIFGLRNKIFQKDYTFQPIQYVHEPFISYVMHNLGTGNLDYGNSDAALRTSKFMDAVLDSYYHGREDSFWERSSTWESINAKSALEKFKNTCTLFKNTEYLLTEEQLRFFFERGFIGPFKCDSPELDRLAPPPNGDTLNQHLYDPVLMSVCSHPSVISRVSQLLGTGEVKFFKSRYWVKPPHAGRIVPWHQDIGYNNGGYFKDGYPIPSITVWMGIDEVNEENGMLKVIPYSHKRFYGDWKRNLNANLEMQGGLDGVDTTCAVPVKLNAGEFIIFHSWILHSSGPNRTDKRRAAVNMRFVVPGNEAEAKFTYITLGQSTDTSS